VWGLLKYYHPNVTAGKLDWDNVLLDCLDHIKTASSPEEASRAIGKMIQTAGEYKISKKDRFPDSLNINMSLCWIDGSFLDKDIGQSLHEISSITVVQPSYYSPEREKNGPYIFKNEKNYEIHDLLYDSKYRLLSLFRYWNAIYWFSPYKYLMDKSWDIVLSESVSKFISAGDIASYGKAVTDISVAINDGHAFTSITPHDLEFTEYFTVVDSNTVVRIPPEQTLLERGDIILKIGNREIWNVRDSLAGLIASSCIHYTGYVINSRLYQIAGGSDIVVQRNNRVLTIPVKFIPAFKKKTESSVSFKKISDRIGYANLGSLKTEEISAMFDSLKHTKGIILDLRNFPHVSFYDIIRYFTTKQEHEYIQLTFPDLLHPGAFYWGKKVIWSYTDEQIANISKYNGKIVVLVSEIIFSAAETNAVMYRTAGNAILIGRPTAGSNGDLTQLLLPDNVSVHISGLGAYYPDRTETQRKGIIPDIEVYPDMQSIMAGKDEILEAAISYIENL
jgi:hypothetical protein